MKNAISLMTKTFTMRKTMCAFVLAIFLVLSFVVPVSAANQSTWYDPTYNFGAVVDIWVKNPVFTYDFATFKLKANDKVERYSEKHSEQNISDKVYEILQKKTEKLKGTHFTFQKNGAIQTEFTDLILIVKAKDLGWFHSYYPAGQKAQNVLVSSTSREVIVNGKKQTLTDEKYERRMVPYPAGYNSRDSAAGEFELVDAKTGKVVWRFTDTRDRSGYDETGPESMFGRIVSTAYDKMKDRVKMK